MCDLSAYDVICEKIQWADIIYVGGGNTLKLMNLFRKYRIDELLRDAYHQNKVLCGLSAGAICWCAYGNSDSRKYTSESEKLIKVTGLGFLPILMCPHYDVDTHRRGSLKDMMRTTYKMPALALDNGAALKVIDDKYKIITSAIGAKATKCFWKNSEYIERPLEKDVFLNLEDLYGKF